MTTSEPTTGELIEQLHTFDNVDAVTITIAKAALLFIADRLESQERTIDELEDECGKLMMTIDLLTARAEKAEAERDAAVAVIGIQAKKLKESHVVLCNICKFEDMIGCVHKNHCDGYQLFKWRVLPQDGEGV